MAEAPRQRHRLGVLPGLGSATSDGTIPIGLGTNYESDSNKQLIALTSPTVLPDIVSKKRSGVNLFPDSRSPSSEHNYISTSQVQNVTNRISAIEEANRALLEEIYRLQSYVRSMQHEKKESQNSEKKLHGDIMEGIRASNDVISQLTNRLRTLEDKLHVEKENRKSLLNLSKKLEQSLVASQHETHSQEDKHNAKFHDIRQRIDEMGRQWERSERTSQSIVEEFHQLKSKFEMQTLEFSHMQTEVRQRTKRQEDETKEAILQAKYQKDSNAMSEQTLLQLRQYFESRLSEVRDTVSDVRNKIAHTEAESRSQNQQATMRLQDIQAQMSENYRHRQEELQALQRSRQEKDLNEESERNKLNMKIQESVEQMSEKLLQKEVRLREEALRKFVDLERLVQKEQAQRMGYEKQTREDNDKRWNMQQTVLQEEIQAMKEIHRTERSKHYSSTRKLEDEIHGLNKKVLSNRKAIEKVLIAEITKRESQAKSVADQIESVQDQLRVALSSLQQAIGGLQFQISRDKEQFMGEVKEKLTNEVQQINRGMADADARLTALSVRMTHQEDSLESKLTEMSSQLRTEQREALHNTEEWRENLTKDMTAMHEVLQELPQEVKEMHERFNGLKEDLKTKTQLEADARMKESEGVGFKIRALTARMESVEANGKEDRKRLDVVEQSNVMAQSSRDQIERLLNDVRQNLNVRLNSETKMRLEETTIIKREMARLRMDIQPILWKQMNASRKFVKKDSGSLNEWGIYQCARWHDIKMRWLRLLSRSRRRRRNHRQNAQRGDLETGSVHPDTSDASYLRSGTGQDNEAPTNNTPTSNQDNQQWYNQDNSGIPLRTPEDSQNRQPSQDEVQHHPNSVYSSITNVADDGMTENKDTPPPYDSTAVSRENTDLNPSPVKEETPTDIEREVSQENTNLPQPSVGRTTPKDGERNSGKKQDSSQNSPKEQSRRQQSSINRPNKTPSALGGTEGSRKLI